MKESFKALRFTERVYWVRAIDWPVRDFHGYLTSRGTTYNSYLVLADKVTLIDTVKPLFKHEMLSRIASSLDPGSIQYIVSNHSEMDHSGCLPEVVEAIQPERVFASPMGVKTLSSHFHNGKEISAVRDGESISLGNMNLSFLETQMPHWPDSMFSFLAEEELLFSQDACRTDRGRDERQVRAGRSSPGSLFFRRAADCREVEGDLQFWIVSSGTQRDFPGEESGSFKIFGKKGNRKKGTIK